jgi:sialate O-acetylesterase
VRLRLRLCSPSSASISALTVSSCPRVWATAKIVGNDKLEVSAASVAKPIAVRYAWADNPVANLFSKDGLPVTPFRSDDFEMITKPKP